MAQELGPGFDLGGITGELPDFQLDPDSSLAGTFGDLTSAGLSGLNLDFGGEFGQRQFPGNFGMVEDLQTGRMLTFDEAMQVDPAAFAEFQRQNPHILSDPFGPSRMNFTLTSPETPSTIPGSPPSATPGSPPSGTPQDISPFDATMHELLRRLAGTPLGPDQRFSGLTDLQRILGFGGGLLALGSGVAGLIQRMMRGDRGSRERLTQVFAEASPEQKLAINNAIRSFELAQSTVPGILETLGQRAPLEQRGFEQGLGGLRDFTSRSLAGQLPIGPELERTVEEAHGPAITRALLSGVEDLQNRGFGRGFQDASASLTPFVQQALAEQAGQMAKEKLDLGLNLSRFGLGGLSGLLGLGQQGVQNRMEFLQSRLGPGRAFGQLGLGLQPPQGFTRTSTSRRPFSLLDAFDPLSRLLISAGGLFGGAQAATASGAPSADTMSGLNA